ncbi:uncharacterized protein TRUGW13939_05901 [Talaromyces rugulosus]|uniref:Carboxylic ester hydrolase n=1 Tax=Talaromyces rugulosus TaxID=121627 RepID=A0A7H8QXD5_TALRU|nr:uncharacterized protein TRUGW13939_05901 [Talaromyces rugulosus]QKX58774.1 hypothetical protein TRUGW13939_05901 [Talaromyces rugulosus]
MHLASFLGLCLLSATASKTASSVTVLFHNDGDWTTHEQKQSALFVNQPATHKAAVATCASYGETLLDCDQFGAFANDLAYQEYNHDASGLLFWSKCNSSAPINSKGALEKDHAGSDSLELPFLCTNTAPFVKKVDTDYSGFPRVQTPQIEGTSFEGLRDHMAFRFMGIPFAKPPTGDLRFKYAQSIEYTDAKVNATAYGPACLQSGQFDGNSEGLNPWGNSEDCLSLQVFTPSLPVGGVPSKGLKPVMVWIYGGGLATGTSSDSTFDGDSLASRGDVVVVAFNYRLNIFGLLTLNDGTITGNYHMSDQITALQWVKKYIAAFGGDPGNITIFGQSAGAASVMGLVVSPEAKGLFNGAIAQSIGGFVKNQSVAAAEISPYLQPLCHNSTGEAMLKCLQGVPTETLLNASSKASWQTVIDTVYMPEQPLSLVSQGKINSVNLMLGFMPEEGQSLMATAIAPNATNFNASLDILLEMNAVNQTQINDIAASGLWDVPKDYNNIYNATANLVTDAIILCYSTEFVSAGSSPAGNPDAFDSLWVYEHQRGYALSYYDYYNLCTFPVGKPDTPYYRCHSSDLYEVFGTYYLFDQPVRVADDIYYTNAVQDIWTAFARTGNPNPDKAYLAARGYNSTAELFGRFQLEEYGSKTGQLAKLQWPQPWYDSIPDQDHCRVMSLDF